MPGTRYVRGSAAALVPITARVETSLLAERAALQGAIAVALRAARAMLLSHDTGTRTGVVRANWKT